MSRSRNGCLACRRRKVKCSEEHPICAQCARTNRECIPHAANVFRHQHNPSLLARSSSPTARSRTPMQGLEPFPDQSVWMHIPKELSFVLIRNPYNNDDEDETLGDDEDEDEENEDEVRDCGASPGAGPGTRGGEASTTEHDTENVRYATSPGTHTFGPPKASLSCRGDTGIQPQYPNQSRDNSPLQVQLRPQDPNSALIHDLWDADNADMSIDETHDVVSHQPAIPQNLLNDPTLAQCIDVTGDNFLLSPAFSASNNAEDVTLVRDRFGERYSRMRPEHPVARPAQRPLEISGSAGDYGADDQARQVQPDAGCLSMRRAELTSNGPEIALLLREFSEFAAASKDFHGHGVYYSARVPQMAAACPALMYSCAAFAATIIGRSWKRNPDDATHLEKRRGKAVGRRLALLHDAEGWLGRAQHYYDLAVTTLEQGTQVTMASELSGISSQASLTAMMILCDITFPRTPSFGAEHHSDIMQYIRDSLAETLVSSGTPSTLGSGDLQSRSLAYGPLPDSCPPLTLEAQTADWIAMFWEFARQDMRKAFVWNTFTHLDLTDFALWRRAGLKLDSAGRPHVSECDQDSDTRCCNTLVYLLMKVVNFIAVGDETPETAASPSLGAKQADLLQYWTELEEQLCSWHHSLSSSFKPSTVLDDDYLGEVKWFLRPEFGIAMQNYHFARIHLLNNKPHLSTGQFDLRSLSASGSVPSGASLANRHASYMSIARDSQADAREIVAISSGLPNDATMLHCIQPLWTSGLILGGLANNMGDQETKLWRTRVVELLQDIETVTGVESEYRAAGLLEVWGVQKR